MGRLTLNVLLSFAQFEREVTSERIRDKIAASKPNRRIGCNVISAARFESKHESRKPARIEIAAELGTGAARKADDTCSRNFAANPFDNPRMRPDAPPLELLGRVSLPAAPPVAAATP